jgi:hypothetical protein
LAVPERSHRDMRSEPNSIIAICLSLRLRSDCAPVKEDGRVVVAMNAAIAPAEMSRRPIGTFAAG